MRAIEDELARSLSALPPEHPFFEVQRNTVTMEATAKQQAVRRDSIVMRRGFSTQSVGVPPETFARLARGEAEAVLAELAADRQVDLDDLSPSIPASGVQLDT